MKLILLDENLPRSLRLPSEALVRHVNFYGSSLQDSSIWDHAREADAVIVTKDSDFAHRIMNTEPPPRVVHVCLGNMKFTPFKKLMEEVWPRAEELLKTSKLVNIYDEGVASLNEGD